LKNISRQVEKMKEKLISYKKSGEILSKTLDHAVSITKPGKKLLDIAEEVENYIRKYSAKPAFPLNISINEIAAHYSPKIEDNSTIPEKSIVKLDIGVSVNGYLTDAARTVIFDKKWKKMKDAAKEAFDKAVIKIKPNSTVYAVGETVETTLRNRGFKPIVNLSGHLMLKYSLHGGVSIPNYKVPKRARLDDHKFISGNAYAIEPFATTGIGRVYDDEEETIFRQFRNFRDGTTPKNVEGIYNYINDNFCKLPFSWRWVYNAGYSNKEISDAKRILIENQIVHGYPVLIEEKKAPVTQYEDTIFVGKNKVYLLTRRKSKTQQIFDKINS
jgi:methionyl aminopeptidase